MTMESVPIRTVSPTLHVQAVVNERVGVGSASGGVTARVEVATTCLVVGL
jgi:hypothetical protein